MDVTDWQKISLLDYALPGFFVSSALKGMIQKKWGRILLFGGTGTDFRTVFKTNAAYAGAKTGTGVLVQSVASLYAGHGITCNAVLPGFTQTEYLDDKTVRDLEEKIPGHTLISAGDIAKAAELNQLAADGGDVQAQNALGWMYDNGIGVEQDYVKAKDV